MPADYGFDGMIKVAFVPTLTVAAPTVTQVAAGTPLDGRLTPDGLDITSDTGSVDTSKLNSTGNSEIIGRDTFSVTVKYVRGDQAEAVAVQTALVRGAQGYIVVRRDKLATVAWTVGDKVDFYPVQCKRPSAEASAPETLQAVTVGMAVTDTNSVRGIDNPATLA